MPIIIAILVFCVIILLHELGHFIAAKLCGIYVKEFAFGMGPVILRKKGKETEYVIRAFPIGGSCSFEGENGGYAEGEIDIDSNPRAFNRKPVWQRMIVILAGPLMNLILGYIVVIISLLSANAIASTTIVDFREQSVSDNYLQKGDEILSVDGLPIFSISDVTYKLQSSDRKNAEGNLVFDFEVLRNGEKVTLRDVEFMTIENDNGLTGIYFDFYVYPLEKNFKNVVVEGASHHNDAYRYAPRQVWTERSFGTYRSWHSYFRGREPIHVLRPDEYRLADNHQRRRVQPAAHTRS